MRYRPDGPSPNGAKCFNCGATPQARWEGGELDVNVCAACATRVLPALIADAVFVGKGVESVSDHRKHLDAVRAAYWEAVACRMRPGLDTEPSVATSGSGIPTDLICLTLWEIRGEAGNDSGGGDEVVWAFSHEPDRPPNPHDAIRAASGGRYAWYSIASIRSLGPVSSSYRIDHTLHDQEAASATRDVEAAISTTVGAVGHTPAPFVGTRG